MKKINKPAFTISNVVESSIVNMRKGMVKDEISNNLASFQTFEDDFDTKKQVNQLHLIRRNICLSTLVDYDVLKKLYTERMLNKTNEARKYYNALLISAPKGKCPNCNVREANTLDHYLPKSGYPMLSVSPLNLIPSCSNCNTGKLIDYPTSEDKEVIHPYYDDVEHVNWLQCKLINMKPLIFEFSVINRVFSTVPILETRLKNHFSSFDLNTLYKTHASEEFENIKFQLEKLYKKGGNKVLTEHLNDCYESRNMVDINSWQTAFYKCLYENNDFCNGNFI